MDPDSQARAADIQRKLDLEAQMRTGAINMRAKLRDRNALAECDRTVAECDTRIAYLSQQLARLNGSSSLVARPATPSVTPPASELAVAVPVHSSPSRDSLAGAGAGAGTGSTPVSPALSTHGSMSSLPSIGSLPAASATPASSSGLLSYLKKTIRSKSSSSISASAASPSPGATGTGMPASASTSSLSGSSGAPVPPPLPPNAPSATGPPAPLAAAYASDPRAAFAATLPGQLGTMLLEGPPPPGSLPDLEPAASAATDDAAAAMAAAPTNLVVTRTGVPLGTPMIESKMRDLTYKLHVAGKEVAGIRNDRAAAAVSRAGSSEELSDAGAASALARADALKRALNKYAGLYVPDPSSAPTPPTAGHPGSGHIAGTPTAAAAAAAASVTGSTGARALAASLGALHLRDGGLGGAGGGGIDGVPPPAVTTLPRKPPSAGDLTVHIVAARVPPSVKNAASRADHYVAVVTVDGAVKHRTRAFKAPKDKNGCETEIPFNEVVVVPGVPATADVEVVLVEADKHGVVRMCDGLLWFRVADVVAEATSTTTTTGGSGPEQQQQPEVHGWYNCDPVGSVLVRLAVSPVAARARKISRLGRAGAVRKRKQVEATRNGHEFVLAQFANIVRCALCSEFIGVSSCYSCEQCGFSCHKKCAPRVLTRCLAVTPSAHKSSADDDDDEPLPHNIPHRFQPTTNLSAHWCCHCGHLVPLGRGNVKCGECSLVAHKDCALMVPNFCGLNMKRANKLLHEIKLARDMRAANAIRIAQRAPLLPGVSPTSPVAPAAAKYQLDTVMASASASTLQQQQQQQQAAFLLQQQQQQQQQQMAQPAALPPAPAPQSVVAAHSSSLNHPLPPRPLGAVSDVISGSQELFMRKQAEAMAKLQEYMPASAGVGLPQKKRDEPAVGSTAKPVSLEDFHFLAVLGKGNFGKVMLAEEKRSRKHYAIKVLKKDFVLENDEVESTRSEKRIFQAANAARHPFLVSLYATLQTASRLYFVMEYVSGGDLMLHIQREQFTERRAKFYAAEVLLALEFFHQQKIVYRDLKLDNIMLGLDGHIKLADYGLCKENMGLGATTNTFCGTPEFMAPEILFEQSYGRAVDWWAFGVLVYEMLCGQSPFRGDDEEEIFESILHDEVLYPITMSRDAVHLCQGLLTKDPVRRLGAGPNDAAEIRAHPFFRGVDWEGLLTKKIAPPFVPKITSATDTSNFDEEFTGQPPVLTPVQTVLDDTEQLEFAGFSYVANWVNVA
ncbi:hypothetical protein BC828DRAFT_357038 [Blastocladiella britannica]|nr:hypothetical protein BC828DRAFT_357038 [Blastocladiella britannica]